MSAEGHFRDRLDRCRLFGRISLAREKEGEEDVFRQQRTGFFLQGANVLVRRPAGNERCIGNDVVNLGASNVANPGHGALEPILSAKYFM